MASNSSRLNESNWGTGQPVSLFSALGFKQPFNYPKLTPSITSSSSDTSSTSGTSDSGTAGNRGSNGTGTATGSAGGLSGNLSFTQLQQLWVNAGGNPAFKVIAAAVAMAESGGRQNASNNDTNGTVDRGYWQINSSHGSQSTYDPLGNARAAIAISNNGTNWAAWVTFNSGAYKQFLPNGG